MSERRKKNSIKIQATTTTTLTKTQEKKKSTQRKKRPKKFLCLNVQSNVSVLSFSDAFMCGNYFIHKIFERKKKWFSIFRSLEIGWSTTTN